MSTLQNPNPELENLIKGLKVAPDLVNLEESLVNLIKRSIETNEAKITSNQSETFKKWNEIRDNELQEQVKLNMERGKMQEFEQQKIKLAEEERKLFFFDNYEAMEKEKRERLANWRKYFPRRTFMPQIKLGITRPGEAYSTRKSRWQARKLIGK